MIFNSSDHAERFAAAIQTAGAVRDDDTIKGDYGASLYILTGLPGVYSRAQQHIHHGYIDFEPMLNMGLSTGETILVALAGNLYNGGFFDRYTPEDIVSYCDTDGVLLAARALTLRKQRLDINTVFD
ncbi:hypothetical protein [uncultured Oscillibacter sp.]|uniref:hypothetical protein n=1 Tax=uncultured Oscillibacter sp. TaxID=876091 RepID=UPI0025CDA544|nr:hypothetical protein [uncultured Oscillibacter sp.]